MFRTLSTRIANGCTNSQWLRMGNNSVGRVVVMHKSIFLRGPSSSTTYRAFSSPPDDDDNNKTEDTVKKTVVSKWDKSKKYWMSSAEYTGVVVGKEATGGDYVITDGIIGPGGFVPDHYHKWEDQTFHVITGEMLEAKIGNETFLISQGDSIHCPRGVSHYIKNIGSTEAKLISYIFPGHWAEDFMAETSRQSHEGTPDFQLIEEKFGVVYL